MKRNPFGVWPVARFILSLAVGVFGCSDDADPQKRDAGNAGYAGNDSAIAPNDASDVRTLGSCSGVVCDTPPDDFCADDRLHVYSEQGVCDRGECTYTYREVECADGCELGQCTDDPCEGIICDTPPPRHCEGDELVVWDASGSCTNGACEYPSQRLACESGCSDGACLDDACLDVTCDDPPAATCQDPDTLQLWDGLEGVCVGGECLYGSDLVTCQQGCSDGECTGEPCAGVTCTTPGECETAVGASCLDGDCSYPADTDADCDDGEACTRDDQCGSDKRCQGTPITACQDGDDCCPSGCDSGSDDDCIEPLGATGPIAVGTYHNCVVSDTGNVRCWGWGQYGQLGYGNTDTIGDNETAASAGDVDIGGPVVQVAAGAHNNCALLDTGTVRCWGTNNYGELGYGHTNAVGDNETPASQGDVDVGGIAVQVTTGRDHSCALLDTGNVRCWGKATPGTLGYGTGILNPIGDDETPASAGDINVGGFVVQISSGFSHVCALLNTGKVRCWGGNVDGQLGYAHTDKIGASETPDSQGDVDVGGTVVQMASGQRHSCVLLDTGRVRCWGWNAYGQLGYGNAKGCGEYCNSGPQCCIGDDEVPASTGDVDVGGTVVQIAPGSRHTCALLNTGKVRCWGDNRSGQLGYGNADGCGDYCEGPPQCCIGDDETPASAGDVDVGGTVVQLSTDTSHTCALLDTGGIRCWGAGYHGVLGHGAAIGCPDNCTDGPHCCIGDDETPASVGEVPF